MIEYIDTGVSQQAIGDTKDCLSCAQCKYGEKWDNGEYHCLKEIGTENSSLHSGNWFCADFKETSSYDADDSNTTNDPGMRI